MDKKPTYDELTEQLRCMEAEIRQSRNHLEQIVSQATQDLQKQNHTLQKEINKRKRIFEQLEASRQALKATNKRLEMTIFKSNQMTADAEIRNYHLENEIERRKQVEALLRESENKYRSIIENIEDGYCEIDASWNINFFNTSLGKIFNLPAVEMVGLNWSSIVPAEDVAHVFKTFSATYISDKSKSGYQCRLLRKDNTIKHIELSLTPMTNPSGQKIGLRSIVRDVDKRKQYEEKLIYLAYHDALTGLNNRKAFYEQLEQDIKRSDRYNTELALLYIDIDRFKLVNDTLGHQAGDALLGQISLRLKDCLRTTDYIARVGGDEFTVIMYNPLQLTPEAAASRIINAVSNPYEIKGEKIDFITASVGIGLYPKEATGVDSLISTADSAMYTAKEKGNRFSCRSERPAKKTVG